MCQGSERPRTTGRRVSQRLYAGRVSCQCGRLDDPDCALRAICVKESFRVVVGEEVHRQGGISTPGAKNRVSHKSSISIRLKVLMDNAREEITLGYAGHRNSS